MYQYVFTIKHIRSKAVHNHVDRIEQDTTLELTANVML